MYRTPLIIPFARRQPLPYGKVSSNQITFLLCIAIIVLLGLGIFLPWLSDDSIRGNKYLRSGLLQIWHSDMQAFFQDNKRPPASIFELCRAELEQGKWPVPFSFLSGEAGDPKQLARDPNHFAEICLYGLFSGPHGWIVKELKPGKFYTGMLMIDQDGRIYELTETAKPKQYKN
jgi:hypothetical protein